MSIFYRLSDILSMSGPGKGFLKIFLMSIRTVSKTFFNSICLENVETVSKMVRNVQ